jgi:hypothetical protein
MGSSTHYRDNYILQLESHEELFQRDLARIFHTDRDEEAAKADGVRRSMKSDDICACTHCPRSNSKLTQYPSGVRKPQQNRYEISGLITRIAFQEPLFLDIQSRCHEHRYVS